MLSACIDVRYYDIGKEIDFFFFFVKAPNWFLYVQAI